MIKLRDAYGKSLPAFLISQGGLPDISGQNDYIDGSALRSSESGIGLIVSWFSKIAMPVKSAGLQPCSWLSQRRGALHPGYFGLADDKIGMSSPLQGRSRLIDQSAARILRESR
jgi:hypothetical protein